MLLLFICFLFISPSLGRIQKFELQRDTRQSFEIETFGFETNGDFNAAWTGFELGPPERDHTNASTYIILRAVDDTSEADKLVNTLLFEGDGYQKCLTEVKYSDLFSTDDAATNLKLKFIPLDKSQNSVSVKIEKEGRIQILVQRCTPSGSSWYISGTFTLTLKNPSGYLSAGDASLPGLLMAFFIINLGLLSYWIYACRKAKDYVHKIHLLMAALVLIKTLSVFFESLSYGAINTYGHPIGWNVLFYIFYFIKGLMIFIVILLLGMGWSFLRPFLKVEEKKYLLVIFSLQIVANIAYIVTQDASPGTSSWISWLNILHLVDFLCCILVLFPILYTIQHLQRTGSADGKRAITLNRLKQFRELYFCLMAYIYFSRLVLPFIASILPYQYEWLGYFLDEVSTVAFFIFVGYRFQPMKENPYIHLDDQDFGDDELNVLDEGTGEFGLDDDDLNLSVTPQQHSDSSVAKLHNDL